MSDRVFLDSNILIYAYDKDDPAKQGRAANIVNDGIRNDSLALSTQVLGEFFVTATRKIKQPMSAEDALGVIRTLTSVPLVDLDRALVLQAIEAHRKHRISYWDGLIIAAAERAGCNKIFSEDLSDGQQYGSVVVENPFRVPTP